jgi:putative methionine-R-sulfoxide reductase with GAF domain
MNRRFFSLPADANQKMRVAFQYASIIMFATLIAFLVEAFLSIRTGAWQLWGGTAVILFVFVAAYVSRQLSRKGQVERAAKVLIYSILIATIANPLLIADIGIGLGLTAIMMTVVLSSQTTERPERLAIISFLAAVITIFLDLLLPPYRLVVPELQLFTPVITGVVVVILGYRAFQGFKDFNLRIKLITVIISVVFFSVAVIGFLANRSLSANLTENVGNSLSAVANSKAIEISQTLKREVGLLKTLALDETIENTVEAASRGEVLTQEEIQRLDSQWRVADANDNNASPIVSRVLYNRTSTQLRQFQQNFSQHVEVFLTNQQGINIATTNRTSDYYQGDEAWWQIAYRERIYIGQPEYDESTKTTVVIIAIAIRDEESQNVLGILRTTINFDFMAQALAASSFGQTGQIVVYLPNRQELALVSSEENISSITQEASGFDINELFKAIDSKDPYFEIVHRQTRVLASQAGAVIQDDVSEDALAILKLNWRVIVFQDLTEAVQPVQAQTRNLVIIALIIFIAATFAAMGLSQIISGPLVRLNAVAEQVAAGDLSAQAIVETGDETGTLATTFNSMTAQLRDLIGTLEQRVADRTKALATSAEISRYLSTILNERQLIIEVVEQLKTAFDYYHVHIYLLDEASGDLIMAGGTGDVGASLLGSGHKVSKEKGLVGRAAHNNIPVLVSDTSSDPDWLPNPLLPETRSEAAIPIASADKVLGVLDVQHNVTNRFTKEDIDLLQSLANQVAIALLNARSYVDVQQRADREARITSIGLKIKSTTSIEAALQATARELGRTLGVNDIRVILEAPGTINNSQKPD